MGACTSTESRKESNHIHDDSNLDKIDKSQKNDQSLAIIPRGTRNTMIESNWDLGKFREESIAPCPERGDLLKSIPLLAQLSEEERDRLGGMMVERRFKPGRVVFSQGETPDGLYFIVRGGARIEGYQSTTLKLQDPVETNSSTTVKSKNSNPTEDSLKESQRKVLRERKTAHPSNKKAFTLGEKKETEQNHFDEEPDEEKSMDFNEKPDDYVPVVPPANLVKALTRVLQKPESFEQLPFTEMPKAKEFTVLLQDNKDNINYESVSSQVNPYTKEKRIVVFAHLKKGDYFGETALISNSLRTASVVCDPRCDGKVPKNQNSAPEVLEGEKISDWSDVVDNYVENEAHPALKIDEENDFEYVQNKEKERIQKLEEEANKRKKTPEEIKESEKKRFDKWTQERLERGEHIPLDEKWLTEEFGGDSSNDLVTLYLCKDLFDSFFRHKLSKTKAAVERQSANRDSKVLSQRFADNIRTKLREFADFGGAKIHFARRRPGMLTCDIDDINSDHALKELERFNYPYPSDQSDDTEEEPEGIKNGDKKATPKPQPVSSQYFAEPSLQNFSIHPQADTKTKKILLKALRQNAYLSRLDLQQLVAIVENLRLLHIRDGCKYLIEEGEVGVLLYVLVQTPEPLKVMKEGKLVGRISPGTVFGELALLTHDSRTASVLAPEHHPEKTELWAIDRFTFLRICRKVTETTVTRVAQFLQNVPLLQPLTEAERYKVAESVEERHYEAGSVIVREGDTGSCMFLLVAGSCSVYQRTKVDDSDRKLDSSQHTPASVSGNAKSHSSTRHAVIESYGIKINEYNTSGEYFGEGCLKHPHSSRLATVVADDYVVVLKVSRNAFDLLLESPLHDSIISRLLEYGIDIREWGYLDWKGHNNRFVDPTGRAENQEFPDWSELSAIGLLGKGSFGVVRLVESKKTKEQFALKTLDKNQLVKPSQQKQVKNEIRLMSQIKHPFILPLYKVYRSHRHIHMLLPVAEEGDLFSLLRKKQVFTEEKARFYSGIITTALGYLHSKSIIYRDLKPENVLLWKDGYVKLADLGFAKKLDVNKTRTWTICGTPEYLSPEILSGRGHHKTTDWWTLGIFIYEMLASHPPFTDRTQIGIFKSILSGKIVFPAHFSPQARSLITELLNPSSSQRLGNGASGTLQVMSHPWFGLDELDLGVEDSGSVLGNALELKSQKHSKSSGKKKSEEEDEYRKSVKSDPSLVFFDALRLHRIKAPEWKDERVPTALEKAKSTSPQKCVIPISQTELEEIQAIKLGKPDADWDAEFGPKINGALGAINA